MFTGIGRGTRDRLDNRQKNIEAHNLSVANIRNLQRMNNQDIGTPPTGDNGISLGEGSDSRAENAIAIGSDSTARAENGIAIGTNTLVPNGTPSSIAIGTNARGDSNPATFESEEFTVTRTGDGVITNLDAGLDVVGGLYFIVFTSGGSPTESFSLYPPVGTPGFTGTGNGSVTSLLRGKSFSEDIYAAIFLNDSEYEIRRDPFGANTLISTQPLLIGELHSGTVVGNEIQIKIDAGTTAFAATDTFTINFGAPSLGTGTTGTQFTTTHLSFLITTGAANWSVGDTFLVEFNDSLTKEVINIGANSYSASASAYSVCVGTGTQVGTASTSCVIVGNSSTIGDYSKESVTVGRLATIGDNSPGCTAIGFQAKIGDNAVNAISIGTNSVASGRNIAIGVSSNASEPFAVAMGYSTQARNRGVAIGFEVRAGDRCVVMGVETAKYSAKSDSDSVLIGNEVGGTMGRDTTAKFTNTVAIGNYTADQRDQFIITPTFGIDRCVFIGQAAAQRGLEFRNIIEKCTVIGGQQAGLYMNGESNVAIGSYTNSFTDPYGSNNYNIAIGSIASPDGAANVEYSITMGFNAFSRSYGVAIGRNVNADDQERAICIGSYSRAGGFRSVAIGGGTNVDRGADAFAQDSIAIGNGANVNATATDAVCIGHEAKAGAAHTKAVAFGADCNTRVANETVMRGIRSVREEASTTDATPTTVITFPILTSEIISATVIITERNTEGTIGTAGDTVVHTLRDFHYRNKAGTVTKQDGTSTISNPDAAAVSTVALGISGTNLTVAVTAADADDRDWVAVLQIVGGSLAS